MTAAVNASASVPAALAGGTKRTSRIPVDIGAIIRLRPLKACRDLLEDAPSLVDHLTGGTAIRRKDLAGAYGGGACQYEGYHCFHGCTHGSHEG